MQCSLIALDDSLAMIIQHSEPYLFHPAHFHFRIELM